MPLELKYSDENFLSRFAEFVDRRRESDGEVRDRVTEIIAEVRDRGDPALTELTRGLDQFDPDDGDLAVPPDMLGSAAGQCDTEQIEALELAAGRIRAFHKRQMPEDLQYRDEDGVLLGFRWTPLDAVGIYVPGGQASYPSSVLMNALPARAAGVRRIAMAVPAPEGRINPLVLAAAEIAGVTEIWRVGGAQAIAALAYGTEKIAAVDKIVGPGNAYVAEAKRQVFGRVGIDSVAGPSEILVVADGTPDPEWIAADLLSQAEHGADAQSILICDNANFAARVHKAIGRQLANLPRADIAAASWREHGAIIIVEAIEDAVPLIDRLAPEHLELAMDAPERLLDRISHAGAIFLGPFTPEAVGDYVGGPNHVLPTSRTARFASGLSVLDFMKRSTILGCDAGSIARIGPAAMILAESEGLEAHARSVRLRLNK